MDFPTAKKARKLDVEKERTESLFSTSVISDLFSFLAALFVQLKLWT